MHLRALVLLLLCRALLAAPGPGLHYYYPLPPADPPRVFDCDVAVYGGSPAGVMAAVAAARAGRSARLFSFGRHVGGVVSAGLTDTDLGNRASIGGLGAEFLQRVGRPADYRPSEAEAALLAMLAEAKVPVSLEHRLTGVVKQGTTLTQLRFENGNSVRAKVFVDASYEGDLLPRAGVSYTVGREANATYGETLNGIRGVKPNLTRVDPFLPGGVLAPDVLANESAGVVGEADKSVQAYNFRMWITRDAHRRPWPQPAGYDRRQFELHLRYLNTRQPDDWSFTYRDGLFKLRPGDANNSGAFSTDYVNGSRDWPAADYAARERIFAAHVRYQQGFVWFLANDPAVPQSVRDRLNAYGLPADEFPETDGWPHELYVREARRMVGAFVMTEPYCRGKAKVEQPVCLASYTIDCHLCRRYVVDGQLVLDGGMGTHVPRPYGVDYRCLVPKPTECDNLLVPLCCSASHVAYASIRMEPVYMMLGQAAGEAAALALESGQSVQTVDYAKLRERLIARQALVDWPHRAATGAMPAEAGVPAGYQVDDTDADRLGEWSVSQVGTPFVGDGYLHDRDEEKGKKAVVFVPDLPAAGTYDVWLHWVSKPNRATNTPVEFTTTTGIVRAKVDQRNQSGWVKLGSGTFAAGKAGRVVIRNTGTDGFVIADAVRWVRQ